MERIEEFLRAFCATLAAGKMYPVTHPQFKKIVDTTHDHLHHILKDRRELIIGLIENEIVYENRVLFKLSKIFELLIIYAKKKGIEKIYFYSDIQKNDLIRFVSFLLSPEEITGNIEEQLKLAGVNHIEASHLTTPEEQEKKNKEQLSPYENALKDLCQFYEKLAAEDPDSSALQQHLKLIMLSVRDKLAGKYLQYRSVELSGDYDPNVIHSLKLSILSATVAFKLGFNPEEVLATGSAALLYNIGGILSDIIGNDRGNPSQSWEGPHRRNSLGSAKILLKYKETFGTLPIIVAFEHSQRHASPEKRALLTYSSKPHIVSMIIALCESYNNILERHGAHGQTPEEIYRLLTKDTAGWLPPQLLDRFLKIMKV